MKGNINNRILYFSYYIEHFSGSQFIYNTRTAGMGLIAVEKTTKQYIYKHITPGLFTADKVSNSNKLALISNVCSVLTFHTNMSSSLIYTAIVYQTVNRQINNISLIVDNLILAGHVPKLIIISIFQRNTKYSSQFQTNAQLTTTTKQNWHCSAVRTLLAQSTQALAYPGDPVYA